MSATFSGSTAGRWPLVGIAPWSATLAQVGTGDSWTAGTDTGAAVTDAAYSGGSYRAVSFATDAALASRLTGTTTAPEGEYRALLRVARSDLDTTLSLRLNNGRVVRLTRPASGAAGHATWIDLGSFVITEGESLDVQVGRDSGTGEAHLDALLLLPVRELDDPQRVSTCLVAEFGEVPPAGSTIFDGERQNVVVRDTTGAQSALPLTAGHYPQVRPGEGNVLHLLEQTALDGSGYGDNPDSIATTAEVTLTYSPRWLHLPGE